MCQHIVAHKTCEFSLGRAAYQVDILHAKMLLRRADHKPMVHVCSFYPLYPPAAGALLDSSLADKLHLPITPDILLLPSDLNPFAKLLPIPFAPPQPADLALHAQGSKRAGQVVCVNPGRLTKGSGGGTFGCFQISPSDEGKAAALGGAPATNGKLPHQVHARCKVVVKRV